MKPDYDIAIIGGGPAGSSAAFSLASSGWNVVLIEKKLFPRDVVCGEFLSHEVIAAIRMFGLFDEFLSRSPVKISTFRFIPENGIDASHAVPFEAFAMKRSSLDHMLLENARSAGVTIFQPAETLSVERTPAHFRLTYSDLQGIHSLTTSKTAGAYGRQNILDRTLGRNFAGIRSGLNGVKFHIPKGILREWNDHEIAIFSSEGIYCGVNCVGSDEVTLCFLADKQSNDADPKQALSVLLSKNKKFRALFLDNPLPLLQTLPIYGTGNIFFGRRNAVEQGMFMIGDAAGVIAPLAGDGIGMAIESGLLLSRVLRLTDALHENESAAEGLYQKEWDKLFSIRRTAASVLQGAVLNRQIGNFGGMILRTFPFLTNNLLHLTRRRGTHAGF